MNERQFNPEPEPIPVEWDRGLRTIQNWFNEGSPEARLYQVEMDQHDEVMIRDRYGKQQLAASMHDFVNGGLVFRWWQESPAEFGEVVDRDPEVNELILTINGLVDEINTQALEKPWLSIRALIQATAELELLARPYVPRKFATNKDKKERPARHERQENDREVMRPEQSLWRAMTEMGEKFREHLANLGQDVASQLPPLPKVNLPISLPSFGEAGRDRLEKIVSGLPWRMASPFTGGFTYQAGRDRWSGEGKKNSERFRKKEVMHITGPRDHRILVVSKIYNRYDPETGVMSLELPKTPVELVERDKSEQNIEITFQVSRLDLQGIDSIDLPHPISWSDQLRSQSFNGHHKLNDITVDVKTDKQMLFTLDSNQLKDFLEIDALKNLSLRLEEPLRSHLLLGSQLQVRLWFNGRCSGDYRWGANYAINEDFSSTKYNPSALRPLLFDKLIDRRLNRQESPLGVSRNDRNDLQAIIGFLSNIWLTYDRRDAPTTANDPLGATQADRVLRHRIASCEGANIAAANLLGSVMEEGEMIVYVSGYPTSLEGRERSDQGKAVARVGDAHLVLMQLSPVRVDPEDMEDMEEWERLDLEKWLQGKKRAKIIDATPLSSNEKWKRENLMKTRRRRMGQWLTRYKALVQRRQELGKPVLENSPSNEWRQRLKESEERVNRLWVGSQEVSEAAYPALSDELIYKALIRLYEHSRNMGHPFHHRVVNYHYVNSLLFFISMKMHGGRDPRSIDAARFVRSLGGYNGSLSVYLPTVRDLYEVKSLEFPRDEDMRFLQNAKDWQRLESALAGLYEAAQDASIHTIQAVEELVRLAEPVRPWAEEQLRSRLEPLLRDKVHGSFTQFWQAAPFVVLLPDLRYDLEKFFVADESLENCGRPIPGDPAAIKEKFDEVLEVWRQKVEKQIGNIENLLANPPLSLAYEPPTVRWGAMQFLPKESQPPEQLQSSQEYIDPAKLFAYLADNTLRKL